MHTMCRGRLQKQPHIGAQSVRRPSRLRDKGVEVGLPTLFHYHNKVVQVLRHFGTPQKCNSSAIKLEPTASQSFPLHTQLRLLLMAERHIQIFEISLPQVNLRILLSNICAWLNCYQKKLKKR